MPRLKRKSLFPKTETTGKEKRFPNWKETMLSNDDRKVFVSDLWDVKIVDTRHCSSSVVEFDWKQYQVDRLVWCTFNDEDINTKLVIEHIDWTTSRRLDNLKARERKSIAKYPWQVIDDVKMLKDKWIDLPTIARLLNMPEWTVRNMAYRK